MNKTASSALSIMALFAASMATSCSSDSLVTDGNTDGGEGKSVTLTAKVNEGDATTRVGMNNESDDEVSFYWHSDDAILVQTVSGSIYSGTKFTTATATGETSAEFTGTVESGKSLGTYAVYPYSDKHKFASATALTYNLPAKYTYDKVESGIFSKTDGTNTTYRSTNTNIPMVGTIAENAIEFKHIGGLAVIRIDQMPATEGTLTITADQQLCGDFTVDLSVSDPVITTATASDNNTVTFTFSNAADGAAGVFYLPLATGDYSNMKVTINETEVDCGNVTISRAGVTAVSIAAYGGTLTDYTGKLLRSYGGKKYYLGNGKYSINDHKFIDLGLSVLWAETNIGAEKAEDYGNYYAWGEVTAFDEQTASAKKTSYSWSTYKWTNDNGSSFTKYTTNGTTILDKEDDAAYVNWGSSCRMPTKAEIDELTNTANCTWVWSSDKKGITVTSQKTNHTNNSIFLPASGYRINENFRRQGDHGYYWSGSFYQGNSKHAYCLYFSSNNQYSFDTSRYFGYAVRPVAEQ